MNKLWERITDIKVHPLLVLAAWIFFTFKLITTGYLQAAFIAARGYKRFVGPQEGEGA